jgi:hypothetical protein
LGTNCSSTNLLANHISRASQGHAAIEPAITPVYQTKPIDFAILPRSLDQTLTASPFSRPNARQGRVKCHLHLILEIEVSMWQECEQISQVNRKLIPPVCFYQVMNG